METTNTNPENQISENQEQKEDDKYYIAFDKLVEWTGTGKTDKIKIREKVLGAVENHRIDLSRIDDEKTLQYIAGFKRYSTERVIKSLVGEFTQNEKWSVKGALMGECWYNQLYRDWETDRKSTRLNSSHITRSRMPSSA